MGTGMHANHSSCRSPAAYQGCARCVPSMKHVPTHMPTLIPTRSLLAFSEEPVCRDRQAAGQLHVEDQA